LKNSAFPYMGPVDCHTDRRMVAHLPGGHPVMGPVLVHVVTTKGKAYPYAGGDQVLITAQSRSISKTGQGLPVEQGRSLRATGKVFGQDPG